MPAQEIGYASSIDNYLVWLEGLPNIKLSEIIVNSAGTRCLVSAIQDERVGALILDEAKIEPRDEFRRTGAQLSIECGQYLLGRVISPLGQPVDGKGKFAAKGKMFDLDKKAPGISAREEISRQFETGLTLVDMLVPLAYGQRELLMGDARSGKSSFLIDCVVNQKGKGVVCILCLVGKPAVEIKRLVSVLEANKALDYTVVIAAAASERAPLIYLTPSVGMTIAEYFAANSKDVLVVMDDLGVHAKFYREIALLSGRPPGRESYPGDIFYQHAKLVERAGNFNKDQGGKSITCLPVIEVSLDDFSSFMATNLMGMTDGHLLFNSGRYHQGFRPSVDVSLSVSRVGRQTQTIPAKRMADKVKSLLAEASRLETFSRLGSDVSAATQSILRQARQIEEFLKQAPLTRVPLSVQMILMALTFTPFLQGKTVEYVIANKSAILQFLLTPTILEQLSKQFVAFKDENQLIQYAVQLSPQVQQVCKEVAKGV